MAIDDAYTVVLLHLNGADTSTVILDESGKVWARSGNGEIDTAQSKFGGASLLLDGTGDYVSTADSADFSFGTGAFTIDMWIRFNSLPANGAFMELYQRYQDANNKIDFYVYNNAGTYQYIFTNTAGGVATITLTKDSPGLSANNWYHVALVRTGNDFLVFQGGSQCGTTVTDTSEVTDLTGSILIGNTFNGWIDEVRVSKGVARWTTTFTPPTAQYGVEGLGKFILWTS